MSLNFHDIVIININGFEKDDQGNAIYEPKSVEINHFLQINQNKYKLKGIVYHNGNSAMGHF